jgi:TRAP-type C4-dicarboxylate transport system permease small subunit
MIDSVLRIWSRLETVLIGVLMLVALIVFIGGAVVRAIAPAHAVDWAEEVAIYCIIWATVLSGSVLIHERRHISTEVAVGLLPQRGQRVFALSMLLLTLVFCAAMAWYGCEAVAFALLLDERSASTLRVPQAWAVFLALPVGMVLMVLRLILMLASGTRSIAGDMLTGAAERPDLLSKAAAQGDLRPIERTHE